MPNLDDKKVSQLDAVLMVNDEDKFVLNQNGATMRCNAGQIRQGAFPAFDPLPGFRMERAQLGTPFDVGNSALVDITETAITVFMERAGPVLALGTFEWGRRNDTSFGDDFPTFVRGRLKIDSGGSPTRLDGPTYTVPKEADSSFPLHVMFHATTVTYPWLVELPAGESTLNLSVDRPNDGAVFRINPTDGTTALLLVLPTSIASVVTDRITDDGIIRILDDGITIRLCTGV